MSGLPLRFAIEADADVEECYAQIEAENPAAADRFAEALSRAFQLIGDHPRIGAECGALAKSAPGVRRWVVRGFSNYLLLYRVMPDRIEILACLHGARDLE